MTTDRAGPQGPCTAIDMGTEGKDHSALVVYWIAPDGTITVLDAQCPYTPRPLNTSPGDRQ
jgi:hypothetical protein